MSELALTLSVSHLSPAKTSLRSSATHLQIVLTYLKGYWTSILTRKFFRNEIYAFLIGLFRRISVGEALSHPYQAQYHDPGDEPVAEVPFRFDEEFDDYGKQGSSHGNQSAFFSIPDRDRLREMIFEATKPAVIRERQLRTQRDQME